jgi:hypothetical protein
MACMQVAYAELHELVDLLTPKQADAVREIVRQLVTIAPVRTPAAGDDSSSGSRVRRLSFVGMLRSGQSDLSERSEEIIRDEFGH